MSFFEDYLKENNIDISDVLIFKKLDDVDPLQKFRRKFLLPPVIGEETREAVYLCGIL